MKAKFCELEVATKKFYVEYREYVKWKKIMASRLKRLNVNDLRSDYEVSQRSMFVRDEV